MRQGTEGKSVPEPILSTFSTEKKKIQCKTAASCNINMQVCNMFIM